MSDTVMAVLAVLLAFAIFVPCALFASGKWRPSSEEEKPASREVAMPEPASYKVEQTWSQKVTNVALTWVQQSIRPKDGDRPALDPGRGSPGSSSGRGESSTSDDADSVDGPPETWDVDVDVHRPRDDAASTPPLPPVSFKGLIRKTVPWLRHAERPRLASIPPSPEAVLAGWKPTDASADSPPASPVADVHVDVERAQRGQATLSAATDHQPVTGQPPTIEPAPVVLEGVDMSQAPLVPSGDGSAVRIPTAGQLRGALATGGFSRLMAWLRAFKKASNNTLTQANTMHAEALLAARRTRNAYAQAMQAFQAVQADKLDRQMIYRAWQMLELTQAQAAAAANLTRATAQFVVASGGQQPVVAAAVATLQRNHGAIAAAVKASPVNPVENVNWYRQ